MPLGLSPPSSLIKAKQRELVYQIQPDGSKVLKSEQAGAYYRSSSGATMNTMGFISTFFDEQGNAYEINHKKKVARLVEHGVLPHEFIKNKMAAKSIKGYEIVNGLNCAVRTVLVNGKPGGKAYLYLPYSLEVRTEWTTEPGGSLLIVRELYDIEVAEPDAALLRIPEGYSVDNQPEQ